MSHNQWLDAWTSQLTAAKSADLRSVHRWLWSTWKREGAGVAAGLNASLRLQGADIIQPDVPQLFVGQVDTANVLFVNINPGWDARRNATENSIIVASEGASWCFCRELFTRYPAEVGRMSWWSQAIGVAWRVVHGTAPMGMSAREKRTWVNTHVAGWELLPFHSKTARFLVSLDNGSIGSTLVSSMRASLRLAIRFASDVTVVASSVGARLINEFAVAERWPELKVTKPALPIRTKAYAIRGRLLLSLPRQVVSNYSGIKFAEISSAIRRLRDQAAKRPG